MKILHSTADEFFVEFTSDKLKDKVEEIDLKEQQKEEEEKQKALIKQQLQNVQTSSSRFWKILIGVGLTAGVTTTGWIWYNKFGGKGFISKILNRIKRK